ncbi:hypothetical protein DYB36_002048 [Aphanomyces astaci]|uniref:Armadillo repeat-containing domain-containing protein n=1 Tax=Aphanomyces astaci TaxID=112090 RepID=A0A397AFB8_APHAT|nr:hypothetical protein DYB36_002048 [Aphanomyces astaci]
MVECTNPSTPAKAKEQCLAHLANFSYDPINYTFFLRLNLVDMFVDFVDEVLPVAAQLQPPTARASSTQRHHAITIARLAMQAICNVAPDQRFQKVLADNDAIPLILQATHAPDPVTCAAALSTMYFLLDAPFDILPAVALRDNEQVIGRIDICAEHDDVVVRNIALSFIAHRRDIESNRKW